MRFVIDESVNRAVHRFLVDRGYESVLAVDILGQGASDKAVVLLANERAAISVDANRRDFKSLLPRRRNKDAPPLRIAGRISLRCNPSQAGTRLAAVFDMVIAEFKRRQDCADRLMIVEVHNDYVRVYR